MEVCLKTEPILLILANLDAASLNADSDRGPDTTPPTLPCLLPRPQNFTPEAGIGGTRSSRAYVYPQICLETFFRGARSYELKQERNTLSNRMN